MRAIPPFLSLLLVACQGPPGEQVPTESLAGEDQALAEAEAMIDEHPDRLETGSRAEGANVAHPDPDASPATVDD